MVKKAARLPTRSAESGLHARMTAKKKHINAE